MIAPYFLARERKGRRGTKKEWNPFLCELPVFNV